MKAFYIVLLLAFLASCGADVVVEDTKVIPDTAMEETTADIDAAIAELPSEIVDEIDGSADNSELKVVKLEAAYVNPQGPVDMQIMYTLDSEDKIETMNVSATTYDVSAFDTAVQELLGKTLSEASEYSVSGSSLTTAAFRNALKDVK